MGWVRKRPTKAGRIRWRAGYRRLDGSIETRTFPLEREAWDWVHRNEGDKAAGRWVDPRAGAELLEAFLPHALEVAESSLKPKSAFDYRFTAGKWIVPFLGELELRRIDRRAVLDWIRAMREAGAGDRTVQKAHAILRRVLSLAVAEGAIIANPAAGMSLRRPAREPIRAIAEADLWRLAEEISTHYRALVLTLGYAGLRIGEAVALRVRDVDPIRGRLTISRNVADVGGQLIEQASTKTGRIRVVELPTAIREELVAHLEAFSSPGDPEALVFSDNGRMLRASAFLRDELRPAAARVGIPAEIRTHWLRHTAVAIAIANGWDVLSISRMLGHSSPTITLEVYGHLLDEHRERLLAATDERIRRVREQANDGGGRVIELRRELREPPARG